MCMRTQRWLDGVPTSPTLAHHRANIGQVSVRQRYLLIKAVAAGMDFLSGRRRSTVSRIRRRSQGGRPRPAGGVWK